MSVPFPAPYGNPGYSSTPMQMPQQPMYTYRPTSPTPTYPMQSPTPAYITCNPWATNGASYNGCQNFCG